MSLIDRLMDMFNIVSNEGHGSVLLVFVIGIIFGSIIQYSRVDKFEKIAGFSMLKDTVVPKILFLAIGIIAIVLFFEVKMGYASYHIKPMIVSGLIVGGILFGISMAILGKCPGTGPISISEGRIDILVASFGGILGGYVFVKYYDQFFKPLMGENYGKETLLNTLGSHASWFVFIFGILMIVLAIKIPHKELLDEADFSKLSDKEIEDIKANKKFEII